MQSLWSDEEQRKFGDDPLSLRVYTSRLLGRNPDLVLHGGGNTSVKATATDLFGREHEVLYVKGSGWDLATIEAAGFPAVKMDVLRRMAELEHLSDADMVREQRAGMLDPDSPSPSVEAILHAIIPFTFVDHTHADAVVTITNTPDGHQRIADLYGPNVLVCPYVMPGFVLAKKIHELTCGIDWDRLDGIILMNHGVFTFDHDARTSYEKMIDLVTRAEAYLAEHAGEIDLDGRSPQLEKGDLVNLARVRKAVSDARGGAVIASLDDSHTSIGFSNLENVADVATRGPLTPDHVIRTKRTAAILDADGGVAGIERFVDDYQQYFERHDDGSLTCLDPAPRWAVWPGRGTVSFGRSPRETHIIDDIKAHTMPAIIRAEKLGGWKALPERDIFDVEYWELEQAKLRKAARPARLQGRIAIVTGAAGGIGLACARALLDQGAVVAGLDIDDAIETVIDHEGFLGLAGDVTDDERLASGVATTIRRFGGLDILVSNAGTFPSSWAIEEMDPDVWDRSMRLNLTSHQRLMTACIPFLKHGVEPAIVIIGSKNVPAPGPGAGAYSVAKAGLTQLARIAALELGRDGIRVNVIHPNNVFDTAIWTDEVLRSRAEHYGLTVEQYKRNNVLKRAVTSADVAAMAVAMAGDLFGTTTGAQVPVDGGNDRVI